MNDNVALLATIEAVDTRLEEANERYREALETGALLSLMKIGLYAQHYLDERVTHVVLEHSDQGPFLTLAGAVDADGNDLYGLSVDEWMTPEEDLEQAVRDKRDQWDAFQEQADAGAAWNLDERCESAWSPWLTDHDAPQKYLLDIRVTPNDIAKELNS